MKIRADIAAMLRNGMTDKDIAAQAHVSHRKVAAARADLGLSKHRGIRKAAKAVEAFRARTQPTADGHLNWTGTRLATTPSVYVNGRQTSARRLAFQLRYDREPVGRALPGCGYEQCVHPDHIEDQPMREQYAAIFREAA